MPLSRRHFLQSALSPLLAQEARFSADVDVVTLFATARDRKGRIIHDLSREDFRLEEDGRPQEIRYFSRESDLPLKIGILIDTSRSQYGILEHERRASYAFLDTVLREDKDSAFVMKFDVAVTMLQGFTSSRKALQIALQAADLAKRNPNEAEPPREHILVGTKLYDAVRRAARDTMRPEPGRKALILLTDGVDYGSRSRLAQAVEHAQRADTLVYSILYFDANGYRCKGYRREAGSEGSMNQTCESMDKYRIIPDIRRQCRTSGRLTAKSISIKGVLLRSSNNAALRPCRIDCKVKSATPGCRTGR
jgi:VWFA-related protein